MPRSLTCAALLGALLAIMPEPAYAYIDPGLGSLIFQSAMAGVLAVGAAWVGFKMKIKSFFERRKGEEELGASKHKK
jgi:hypothetical protein